MINTDLSTVVIRLEPLFADATAEQAAEAITAAEAAFAQWRTTSGAERARLMHRFADILDREADALARLESADNGKLLRETASKATDGPWSASPVWSPRSHATSAVYSRAHPTGTHASEVIPSMRATSKRPLVRPGDAAWIALASPALAEPLAVWLETCANDLADARHYIDEPNSCGHALAVARAITGSAS